MRSPYLHLVSVRGHSSKQDGSDLRPRRDGRDSRTSRIFITPRPIKQRYRRSDCAWITHGSLSGPAGMVSERAFRSVLPISGRMRRGRTCWLRFCLRSKIGIIAVCTVCFDSSLLFVVMDDEQRLVLGQVPEAVLISHLALDRRRQLAVVFPRRNGRPLPCL